MDSKNVLLAIVLSTLVLVLWATFFESPPTPIETQNQNTENALTVTL